MPKYQYDVNISQQKRFIRRFKKFLLIVVGIICIVIIIIIIDSLRTRDESEQGKAKVTILEADIRKFKTPYFKFTTPKTWVDVPSETTDKNFVYRSFRGKLIEQELKIYVNDSSTDLSATNIMPVSIEAKTKIIPGSLSEHCMTASTVKKASQPVEVTILGAKMMCQLDGTNYLIVVAERGGNTKLNLQRSDGSVATYSILYRSSTIPPESLPLTKILNEFVPL